MTAINLASKKDIWSRFCQSHEIATQCVPLFDVAPDGRVCIDPFGKDRRSLLRRSALMEEMIVGQVDRVFETSSAEGILYLMHRLDADGGIVPLYVGKAGRHGRMGNQVSANLSSIRSNKGKFARWGSNYAYHIGDLSAAALPGHSPEKITGKYTRWSERLFMEAPVLQPVPRFPIRFWCTAWSPDMTGIWTEFGPCPLAFMEYLLIGVAALLFPDDLLNEEGR